METPEKYHLTQDQLADIFNQLTTEGYEHFGPVYRDGALMLGSLSSFEALPSGLYDESSPGSYRVEQKEDNSLFQYAVGPQSFKKFLYPPKRKLWGASRLGDGFKVDDVPENPPKMVFWGVRPCELQAIEILDRVFIRGAYVNEWYRKAREDLVIIAVNCTHPAATCFCSSMGTGPEVTDGFDLSITELKNGQMVLEAGSSKGAELLLKVNPNPASEEALKAEDKLLKNAIKSMKKRIDPVEAAEILRAYPDHPHWDKVAKKCLSCANCTMVCPTCFCSSTEDVTDLTGDHTERWLRWDSCFNGDFSYIHGGKIRTSTKSRYRQWLTHKMSNWHTQFEASGCVGCGRCIAWCPVGIDLTEEIMAMKS